MLAQILSLALTYVLNGRQKQLIWGKNQSCPFKISILTVLKIIVPLDLMNIIPICFRHLFASKISVGSVKKLAPYKITHLRELTALLILPAFVRNKEAAPESQNIMCFELQQCPSTQRL